MRYEVVGRGVFETPPDWKPSQQRDLYARAGYYSSDKNDARAIRIADALNGSEALLEALKAATHELNAIRARDGAPFCLQWGPGGPIQSFQCSEDYFDELVERCHAAIAAVEPTKVPA